MKPERAIQVSVQHVTRAFKEVVALDDVSLDIERGAFVSLLGPSGCGKTTLLRIIVGLDHPDRGRVLINGSDVTAWPPNKRPTNLVFQHGALFPHMSVFDNVAYGLRRKGWKPGHINDRVAEMLRLVQLEGLEKRRPSQLSGGQQRRVGLARALAVGPEVLLLDEPLSALDLKLRKELELHLRRIHQEVGTTFIYVTHDQEEALVMSERVVVMRAGRVIQDATPREIYTNPRSVFVAGFIGETNLLRGVVVEAASGEATFRLSSGEVVRAVGGAAWVRSGTDGVVSIRPELVRIGGELDSESNRLSGAIAESIYLGNHVRMKVGTEGGAEVWLHVPVEDATAGLKQGDPVAISWRPEDGRLLPWSEEEPVSRPSTADAARESAAV
jgi:spermidine/putrescine transport system ATP-binding protein